MTFMQNRRAGTCGCECGLCGSKGTPSVSGEATRVRGCAFESRSMPTHESAGLTHRRGCHSAYPPEDRSGCTRPLTVLSTRNPTRGAITGVLTGRDHAMEWVSPISFYGPDSSFYSGDNRTSVTFITQ
jgi:hypothetical protein